MFTLQRVQVGRAVPSAPPPEGRAPRVPILAAPKPRGGGSTLNQISPFAPGHLRRNLTPWAQRLSSTAVTPPCPPMRLNPPTPGEPANLLMFVAVLPTIPAMLAATLVTGIPWMSAMAHFLSWNDIQ